MKKITFYEYLATNVPSDAHFTINKFGSYRKARSPKELEYQLKNFVKNFGENGLNALAEIHPDRKLLEVNCSSCKEEKSNFSGNDAQLTNMPSRFVNVTGSTGNEDYLRQQQINYSSMLVFGGMALLGVALIIRK